MEQPQISKEYRLLNVCYVPTTSAGLPRLSFFFFFFSFFAAAINSTNEANKAGGMCRKAAHITQMSMVWIIGLILYLYFLVSPFQSTGRNVYSYKTGQLTN